MSRRAAKIDRNQPEIVAALRKVGASIQSLAAIGKGCPDLLVGFRSQHFLMEVKDGSLVPSARQLTPDQQKFYLTWNGTIHVVESVEQALAVIGFSGINIDAVHKS